MTSLQKSIAFMPLTLQIQRFTKAVCLVIFSIDVLWQTITSFLQKHVFSSDGHDPAV